MRMIILAFLLSVFSVQARTNYPDGTLVFSNIDTMLGRQLMKSMSHSHVAIVFDGLVYESDWPRYKATPVASYGKRRATYEYFVPHRSFNAEQVAAMRAYAKSQMGKLYQVRNWLFPKTRPTRNTWCSRFVADVLNRSGRYNITIQDAWDPGLLLDYVGVDYYYTNTVYR